MSCSSLPPSLLPSTVQTDGQTYSLDKQEDDEDEDQGQDGTADSDDHGDSLVEDDDSRAVGMVEAGFGRGRCHADRSWQPRDLVLSDQIVVFVVDILSLVVGQQHKVVFIVNDSSGGITCPRGRVQRFLTTGRRADPRVEFPPVDGRQGRIAAVVGYQVGYHRGRHVADRGGVTQGVSEYGEHVWEGWRRTKQAVFARTERRRVASAGSILWKRRRICI